MKIDIPIIIPVRIESKRCPEKVLRPFYKGKSLTEIACEKFRGRNDVFLVAYEELFKDIAEQYNINFVKRSHESVTSEYFREILTFIDDMPYEQFMCINVCTPFTNASTIESAIELIKKQKLMSLMPVTETKNLFFDDKKHPINKDAIILNSRLRKPVYQMASNFDLVTKERIHTYGRHFDSYQPNDPYLYPIQYQESLDIHTEEDFCLVNACYNYIMCQEDKI